MDGQELVMQTLDQIPQAASNAKRIVGLLKEGGSILGIFAVLHGLSHTSRTKLCIVHKFLCAFLAHARQVLHKILYFLL